MYAPRVFVSIVCVLVAFAVAIYLISGSVLTAVVDTVICAVILQVGYFVGIVFLVRREKQASQRQALDGAAMKPRPGQARNEMSGDAPRPLIGARTFHHGSSEKP